MPLQKFINLNICFDSWLEQLGKNRQSLRFLIKRTFARGWTTEVHIYSQIYILHWLNTKFWRSNIIFWCSYFLADVQHSISARYQVSHRAIRRTQRPLLHSSNFLQKLSIPRRRIWPKMGSRNQPRVEECNERYWNITGRCWRRRQCQGL